MALEDRPDGTRLADRAEAAERGRADRDSRRGVAQDGHDRDVDTRTTSDGVARSPAASSGSTPA